MVFLHRTLLTLAVAGGLLPTRDGVSQVAISEIRIDQPGADTDEYFELSGPPGEDLSPYTYIVIGDNATGDGVIESATSLSGSAVPSDGYFLAVEATFTLNDAADLVTTLNFENGDNVTHVLVTDFTGSVGEDLDTDNDGTLDEVPWSTVTDCVALLDTADGGDATYCDNTIGPEGGVPWHVFKDGEWMAGDADPESGMDTPGGPVAELPVEIGEFIALLDENWIRLRWTTLSELNNAGFRVERWTEGIVRDSRFVPPNPHGKASSYHLQIDRPVSGNHLIRLIQIDTDGTSRIVSAESITVPQSAAISVSSPFPNPADSVVQFSVSIRAGGRVSVRLSDVTGRTIRRLLERDLRPGERHVFSLAVARLPPGPYFIHVAGTAARVTKPFVIL